MTEDQPKRIWKGVWIPKEIWLHPTLTWLQKCVVAEIDSLSSRETACTASNQFLAGRFNVGVARMANMLSDLRRLGIIENISFDGRMRGMRVKAEFTESVNPDNGIREGGITESVKSPDSIENRREHNKSKGVVGDGPKQLVHRFRAEFPDTYCVTAPKQVVQELQAARQMLAAGETEEVLVKLAQLNAKADFAPFRGQSATLGRLQQNLASIKARLNGSLKSAVSDGRQMPEKLELRRIAI